MMPCLLNQETELSFEPQIVQEGIVPPVTQEVQPTESVKTHVEVTSVEAAPMTHAQVNILAVQPYFL